jgi:hypothetical protein
VLSSEGETKATIVQSADKLFLRSVAEAGDAATLVPFVNEVDPEAEEVVFPHYLSSGSRTMRLYNGQGEAKEWFTRSPDTGTSLRFCIFNTGGYRQERTTSYISFVCCM